MTELSYTIHGDYVIPNLKLSNLAGEPIGKYGRLRKHYLQEHRPILYNYLVLSETLYSHLLEIDSAANGAWKYFCTSLRKTPALRRN